MIHHVPTDEAHSYFSRDWVVRPIGITHPATSKDEFGAILCALVHCSWATFEKTEEEAEPSVITPSILLVDPAGRMRTCVEIRKKLNKGCINCGSNLDIKDITKYTYVNNDEDVLCDDCKYEESTYCRRVLHQAGCPLINCLLTSLIVLFRSYCVLRHSPV